VTLYPLTVGMSSTTYVLYASSLSLHTSIPFRIKLRGGGGDETLYWELDQTVKGMPTL